MLTPTSACCIPTMQERPGNAVTPKARMVRRQAQAHCTHVRITEACM